MPAPVMALAPMLAAALAVNEAFLYVSGHAGVAGRRTVGLSLWDPAPACDWLGDAVTEPALSLLPARLWLIGLGHLGQAYLWALGLLPFADAARPEPGPAGHRHHHALDREHVDLERRHAHQHQEDPRHGRLGRATGLFDRHPRAPLRRFVPAPGR